MVVADAILESRRGSRRLNAPDETAGDKDAERVVDRLQRDGADLAFDDVGDGVGGNVRVRRHGAHDGQPLRGDLDALSTKEPGRIGDHRHQPRSTR